MSSDNNVRLNNPFYAPASLSREYKEPFYVGDDPITLFVQNIKGSLVVNSAIGLETGFDQYHCIKTAILIRLF